MTHILNTSAVVDAVMFNVPTDSRLPRTMQDIAVQIAVLSAMLVIHAAGFVAPDWLGASKAHNTHRGSAGGRDLSFRTYFELTRVKYQLNFVIFVIGLLLARAASPSRLTGAELAWRVLTIFCSFSVFLYGGCVYVINNISDIEDDRRKKAHRALPSGKMGETHAWVWAVLNAVLAFSSAQLLFGVPLVAIYGAFVVLNLVYSFGLRHWNGLFVPLCFITTTAPLRMFMGALIGGGRLPAVMYALAFLVYVGMQFARKVVIQNKTDVSVTAPYWLAAYWAAAGALLLRLDVTDASHCAFGVAFVLASLNYFTAIFVPSLRGAIARQLDERQFCGGAAATTTHDKAA